MSVTLGGKSFSNQEFQRIAESEGGAQKLAFLDAREDKKIPQRRESRQTGGGGGDPYSVGIPDSAALAGKGYFAPLIESLANHWGGIGSPSVTERARKAAGSTFTQVSGEKMREKELFDMQMAQARQAMQAGKQPRGGGIMTGNGLPERKLTPMQEYEARLRLDDEYGAREFQREQGGQLQFLKERLALLKNLLGGGGFGGDDFKETTTDQQVVNNAGRYDTVNTTSTRTNNAERLQMLMQFLG